MNINDMKIGQVFKNYKELCKFLGLDDTGGNTKIKNLKDISRFFEYDKKGNSFIITMIYEFPKPPIENIRNYQLLKDSKYKDKLNLVRLWYRVDLNKVNITSDEIVAWSCEECHRAFNKEIYTAIRAEKVLCPECIHSSKELLIRNILTKEHLNFKSEVSFNGLIGINGGNLRFDFVVYDYSDKLLGIIEYDGEFHDSDEIIKLHDKIKNDYCEKQNIPLLRIHHKDNAKITSLSTFLRGIGCELLFGFCDSLERDYIQLNSRLSEINSSIKDLRQERKMIKETLKNEY